VQAIEVPQAAQDSSDLVKLEETERILMNHIASLEAYEATSYRTLRDACMGTPNICPSSNSSQQVSPNILVLFFRISPLAAQTRQVLRSRGESHALCAWCHRRDGHQYAPRGMLSSTRSGAYIHVRYRSVRVSKHKRTIGANR
jgi:hypothetical protein